MVDDISKIATFKNDFEALVETSRKLKETLCEHEVGMILKDTDRKYTYKQLCKMFGLVYNMIDALSSSNDETVHNFGCGVLNYDEGGLIEVLCFLAEIGSLLGRYNENIEHYIKISKNENTINTGDNKQNDIETNGDAVNNMKSNSDNVQYVGGITDDAIADIVHQVLNTELSLNDTRSATVNELVKKQMMLNKYTEAVKSGTLKPAAKLSVELVGAARQKAGEHTGKYKNVGNTHTANIIGDVTSVGIDNFINKTILEAHAGTITVSLTELTDKLYLTWNEVSKRLNKMLTKNEELRALGMTNKEIAAKLNVSARLIDDLNSQL